jgi:hypothetical protein
MAFGANFDPDILLGGPGLEYVAAGTSNTGFMIIWMDLSFHFISTP